jgi:catechol 2,3-dioxygenase-like lactoylglutathione lyase family enzyme
LGGSGGKTLIWPEGRLVLLRGRDEYLKRLETIYHVRDIEASIVHYTEKLGGKLVHRLPWGVAYIDMDGQGGLISLFSVETYYLENPYVREFPGPKVLMSVDNLDDIRAKFIDCKVRIGPLLGEQGDIRGFEAFDDDGNAIFYMEDPKESVSSMMRGKSN